MARALNYFFYLFVLIFFGYAIFQSYQWMAHKPKTKKLHHIKRHLPLVTVYRSEARDTRFKKEAYFRVVPYRELEIKPRVSSEVVWLNPKVSTFEKIGKGELILALEESDFKLKIVEQEGVVAKAETDLIQEEKKAKRALKEYELLNRELPDKERDYFLRIPFLKMAKKVLEGQKAKLEALRLELKRCRIVAPFDLVVTENLTAVGDVVSSSKVLLKSIRADRYLLEGIVDRGVEKFLESGSFLRLKGAELPFFAKRVDVDPKSLTMTLQFLVKNPSPDLLLNDFVSAEIVGKVVESVLKVPSYALVEGKYLWVVEDGRLHKQFVEPLWEYDEFSYLKAEKKSTLLVVTSGLKNGVEGMRVRVAKGGDALQKGS